MTDYEKIVEFNRLQLELWCEATAASRKADMTPTPQASETATQAWKRFNQFVREKPVRQSEGV